MGSDRKTINVTASGHELIDIPKATELLSAVGIHQAPQEIHHISNTNDVFRVIAEDGSRYYIKYHTSDWYEGAGDTKAIVCREVEVAKYLRRRGIRLDYGSWESGAPSFDLAVLDLQLTPHLGGVGGGRAFSSAMYRWFALRATRRHFSSTFWRRCQ